MAIASHTSYVNAWECFLASKRFVVVCKLHALVQVNLYSGSYYHVLVFYFVPVVVLKFMLVCLVNIVWVIDLILIY